MDIIKEFDNFHKKMEKHMHSRFDDFDRGMSSFRHMDMDMDFDMNMNISPRNPNSSSN